eukprot:SAG11_NODE_3660_length_2303_cov_1.401089_6_plen_42_part_01
MPHDSVLGRAFGEGAVENKSGGARRRPELHSPASLVDAERAG